MKTYKQYLQKQGYAATTVAQHVANVQHYLDWKNQNYPNGKEDTKLVECYIDELKQRKNHSATINLQLRSLELYYESNETDYNPVRGVRVRNGGGSFTKTFPGVEQLEELYISYTKREYRNPTAQLRNTALLGLIIYQGLSSTDLQRLEKQHVKLTDGKIEVPASKRTNGRILKLEALQIVPLQDYLQQLPEYKTTLLFTDLDNIQTYLLKQLQAINPEIPHIRLLRQSRIVYWMKVCHAREVQYRAGFKHIGTVEDYQDKDIETLIKELEKHHPLR
jgi:site-specific recombinase XerD